MAIGLSWKSGGRLWPPFPFVVYLVCMLEPAFWSTLICEARWDFCWCFVFRVVHNGCTVLSSPACMVLVRGPCVEVCRLN